MPSVWVREWPGRCFAPTGLLDTYDIPYIFPGCSRRPEERSCLWGGLPVADRAHTERYPYNHAPGTYVHTYPQPTLYTLYVYVLYITWEHVEYVFQVRCRICDTKYIPSIIGVLCLIYVIVTRTHTRFIYKRMGYQSTSGYR